MFGCLAGQGRFSVRNGPALKLCEIRDANAVKTIEAMPTVTGAHSRCEESGNSVTLAREPWL